MASVRTQLAPGDLAELSHAARDHGQAMRIGLAAMCRQTHAGRQPRAGASSWPIDSEDAGRVRWPAVPPGRQPDHLFPHAGV